MNLNFVTAIKSFFKTLFAEIVTEGQVAVKLAENKTQIALAKARMTALQEVNKVKAIVVTDLRNAGAELHTDAEKLKTGLEELIAKL